MISATAWVKRGFAAEYPVQYELNDGEMDRIAGMAQLQLNDARKELAEVKEQDENESEDVMQDQAKTDVNKGTGIAEGDNEGADNSDDELKEYDMDNYDEDEGDEQSQSMGMFGNIKSLAYYDPGEKDPYITLEGEGDEETRQELQIKASDNLILATKTEDDLSYLEVYVYEDETEINDDDGGKFTTSSLYVHHDVMLPSFPLCVEWLDFRVGKTKSKDTSDAGNFAAIGTFEPEIEIWNLDVVDGVYPDLVLGQRPEGELPVSSKKRKKKLEKKINSFYHVDAVLSLSANRQHRNLLVSGSADTTVKLWDLNNGTAAKSFRFHSDKVSSVNWCPTESTVLLSGGYDKRAIVSDLRVDDKEGRREWSITGGGDIEGVKWDPNGEQFYVTTEMGQIHKFDARQQGKSLWTLQAHDSEVSSFDINSFVDGYMVTASTDKTVKLWNLSSDSSGPSMILSRDLDIGKVFSVNFGPDKEVFGHITAAGSEGELKVWDTMSNRTVRQVMSPRLKNFKLKNNKEEKIAAVDASGSESEDDEDDEDDKYNSAVKSGNGSKNDDEKEDDGFEDYSD